MMCIFNPPDVAICECEIGYKYIGPTGKAECIRGVEKIYNRTMPGIESLLKHHSSKLSTIDSRLMKYDTFKKNMDLFVKKANLVLGCRNGWVLSPDDTCVKEIRLDYEYDPAQQYCRSIGGNLVTIRSFKMNEFIANMRTYDEDYWIGIRRIGRSSWKWYGGENTFEYFREGEPGDPPSNCGEMVDGTTVWASAECGFNSKFFCDKTPQL